MEDTRGCLDKVALTNTAKLSAVPALRKGDTIAVVAPAGPVPMERLRPALSLLQKDFKLLVPDDIDRRSGFLAGEDLRRAEEFNAALSNPEVRCIWAARGGYGCSRIVSMLDSASLQKDPVPVVGFSDITVLLAWAASCGLRSIHGPVLTQFAELSSKEHNWMLSLLQGCSSASVLAENLAWQEGMEGVLLGGNLSLLAHLCGTPWDLDYRDTLCIIEDVGERPYAIDRYLQQLLLCNSGRGLATAKGVLLGEFTGCADLGDSAVDAIETGLARVRDFGLPACSGIPVGHGSHNFAFPFGGRARVEAGQLRILDSAVVRHECVPRPRTKTSDRV